MGMHNMPLMDWMAITVLDRIATNGPRPFDVFEWGSGWSTIWFGQKRAGSVTTVDHSAEWHGKVSEAVKAENLPVTALLRLPAASPGCEHSSGHTWAMPGHDFTDYVNAISGSFDLILVDGRARVMCFQNALAHVKPKGWVVLHDAERACYNVCRYYAAKGGFTISEVKEQRSTLFCQLN